MNNIWVQRFSLTFLFFSFFCLIYLLYFKSEFDRRDTKASKFLLSSSTSSSKINDCIRVAESFVDFAFRKHHQVVVSGRIQRNVCPLFNFLFAFYHTKLFKMSLFINYFENQMKMISYKMVDSCDKTIFSFSSRFSKADKQN